MKRALSRLTLMLVSVLVLPVAVFALMPPHMTGSVPPEGGTLTSPKITIKGYSLKYAGQALSVWDVTANRRIEVDPDLDCKVVGQGDCPGCKQQRCTMTIVLPRICPGHRYEVRLDNQIYGYTAGKDLPPCPEQ